MSHPGVSSAPAGSGGGGPDSRPGASGVAFSVPALAADRQAIDQYILDLAGEAHALAVRRQRLDTVSEVHVQTAATTLASGHRTRAQWKWQFLNTIGGALLGLGLGQTGEV